MEVDLREFMRSNRFNDGAETDYGMKIRMWSSLHRSLAAFDAQCGINFPKPDRTINNVAANAAKDDDA